MSMEAASPAPGAQTAEGAPILVMGVGNLLLGDEGVGIHVVRELERRGAPPGAMLLDGGTGGFHLLGHLEAHPMVVLIDAILDGRPPGTVSVLQPRSAALFPTTLSAHEIGLRDLIVAAELRGRLPEIVLVTVSVATLQPMTMALSPPVEPAVARAAETVVGIVDRLRARRQGERWPGEPLFGREENGPTPPPGPAGRLSP